MSVHEDLSQAVIRQLLEGDYDSLANIIYAGLLDQEVWKTVLQTLNPLQIAIDQKNQLLLNLLTSSPDVPPEMYHYDSVDNSCLIQALEQELELHGLVEIPTLIENRDVVRHFLSALKHNYQEDWYQLSAILTAYFPLEKCMTEPVLLHYICLYFPNYGIEGLTLVPEAIELFQNYFNAEVIGIESFRTSETLREIVIQLYIAHNLKIKYPETIMRYIVRQRDLDFLITLIQNDLIDEINPTASFGFGLHSRLLIFFGANDYSGKQEGFFELVKEKKLVKFDSAILLQMMGRCDQFSLRNLLDCCMEEQLKAVPAKNWRHFFDMMAIDYLNFKTEQLEVLRKFSPIDEILPEKHFGETLSESSDPKLQMMLEEEAFHLLYRLSTSHQILIEPRYRKRLFKNWNAARVLEAFEKHYFSKKTIVAYYRTYFSREKQHGFEKLVAVAKNVIKMPYYLKGIKKTDDFLMKDRHQLEWYKNLRISIDDLKKILNHPLFLPQYVTETMGGSSSYLCYLIINGAVALLTTVLNHPKCDHESVNFEELFRALNMASTRWPAVLTPIKESGLYQQMVKEKDIWNSLLDALLENGIRVSSIFLPDWSQKIQGRLENYGTEEICNICFCFRQTFETACHHRLCHHCVNKVRRCPYCREASFPVALIPHEGEKKESEITEKKQQLETKYVGEKVEEMEQIQEEVEIGTSLEEIMDELMEI